MSFVAPTVDRRNGEFFDDLGSHIVAAGNRSIPAYDERGAGGSSGDSAATANVDLLTPMPRCPRMVRGPSGV